MDPTSDAPSDREVITMTTERTACPTVFYAVHEGSAPMTETAICEDCLEEYAEFPVGDVREDSTSDEQVLTPVDDPAQANIICWGCLDRPAPPATD